MQRADQVAARLLGSDERIGRLWYYLTREQRRAVVSLVVFGDLEYAVPLSWQEIEARDRARLVAGFRELVGLGSLVEAALL